MGKRVRVDVAFSPPGQPYEVPGAGEVPNGEVKELDDAQYQLALDAGLTWPEDSDELVIRLGYPQEEVDSEVTNEFYAGGEG